MPEQAEPPDTDMTALSPLQIRRLKAGQLFSQGQPPAMVARALKVSIQSAVRWRNRWESEGLACLGRSAKKGRPRKLSQRRLRKLALALTLPPPHFGNLRRISCGWTPNVLREYILRHFSVRYHLSHCWRLMRRLRDSARNNSVSGSI